MINSKSVKFLQYVIGMGLFLALVYPKLGFSWSSDVQAEGKFNATLAYERDNLYQVHLSPVSNLHWVTTENCAEQLIFDDVLVEIYEKNGQRFGAVFRVIDESKDPDNWASCNINGLFSEEPK